MIVKKEVLREEADFSKECATPLASLLTPKKEREEKYLHNSVILQTKPEMDQLATLRSPFKAPMHVFKSPSMMICLKSSSGANCAPESCAAALA